MWTKRGYKKELLEKMEAKTPKIASLEAAVTPKPLFTKKLGILIGTSCAALALAIGGGFGVSFWLRNQSSQNSLDDAKLTFPGEKTILKSLDATSSKIYLNFATLLAPLALRVNYSGASLAFSPVDAFVAISMEVYASSDDIQKEYCSALGASSMDEINAAVKEINGFFGTSQSEYTNQNGSNHGEFGGANINSLWLEPSLALVEGASDVLKGLGSDYYADVFHVEPTTDRLNEWLQDVAPSGFSKLPEINIPEGTDVACVSSYFAKDEYTSDQTGKMKEEYLGKGHYLDYSLPDGTQKKVDYVENMYQGGAPVNRGDNFVSASVIINQLSTRYYLPDQGVDVMSILDDAVKNNFLSSDMYDLSVLAPYYLINSKLELVNTINALGIAELRSASLQKLCFGECLENVMQSSVLSYDYQGFYAVSATVAVNDTSVEQPSYEPYEFRLNRPYLFTVTRDGLPLFYGVVVDPGYPAA